MQKPAHNDRTITRWTCYRIESTKFLYNALRVRTSLLSKTGALPQAFSPFMTAKSPARPPRRPHARWTWVSRGVATVAHLAPRWVPAAIRFLRIMSRRMPSRRKTGPAGTTGLNRLTESFVHTVTVNRSLLSSGASGSPLTGSTKSRTSVPPSVTRRRRICSLSNNSASHFDAHPIAARRSRYCAPVRRYSDWIRSALMGGDGAPVGDRSR